MLYFLKTDRGVKGILELLSVTLRKYGPRIENVSRTLQALKSSSFDFSSETAKGLYLGAGGPELLAESLSKHINNQLIDFAPELSSKYLLASEESVRLQIPEDFLKEWMQKLEGEVRCITMLIDPSTIRYLNYLNREKVNRIRIFFGNCQENEKIVKDGIVSLKNEGLDIILTQAQKNTFEHGGIFHGRWIGDDKIQISTQVDFKDNSLRGSTYRPEVFRWETPPELEDFERYWRAAEMDIQFHYDWSKK